MGLSLLDIAVWWGALEIVGLSALPIASYICRGLKDYGYSISKPLGLLLLTYISWLISFSSIGYSGLSVLFALVVIAACSLIILWKKGISVDSGYVIKFEVLFFFAFLGFAVIRAYSPDIYWTGGEKLMDIAYINSFIRTQQFPPTDPWMSGAGIFYYYFGYLIVADLIKISGILPSIAFNLATASFFALSLTAATGIGYNLTGRMIYGIITAFFVTIAGNLVGFFQLADTLFIQKGGIDGILSFSYWTSSRVIPDTITEFPFFSFLQGDVHAHMISITFQLLVISLLLNVMKSRAKGLLSIFVLGLSVGFLYPLNTWDYPVYLLLAIVVIVSCFIITKAQASRKDLLILAATAGATAVLSYLLYLPYHALSVVERAISSVPSGRTEIIYYLAVYGLFIYLLYSFAISKYKNQGMRPEYLIIFPTILPIISVWLGFELLVVLIPLLILSAMLIFKEKDENHIFVLILISTGVLICLFAELFYIKDALGSSSPANIRMNTVFKLYLQNWVLWGLAAGAVIYEFREHFTRRTVWSGIAMFLILMVSIYPVFATIGKSGAFRGEPTLDGEAYIKKEHPQDYEAVLWFRNVSGQPVVLQAPGESYKWTTYITAFTGLPTVIGWTGHELTWRYPRRQEVDARLSDTGRMYTSLNLAEVDALLQKYNVSYVYFGTAEIEKYSSPQLFESHPERFGKVFEYEDVAIYKVKPSEPEN